MTKQKKILITGISSGIGQEVFKICRDEGWQVHGVVRKASQYQALVDQSPQDYVFHQVDLADREQVTLFVDAIQGEDFDFILLNAGTAQVGGFDQLPVESIYETMEANLLSNMRLVHGLLPQVLKNRTKVVFVSSLVANFVGGKYAAYATSKAGLSHFYRSLAKEYPQLPLLCLEIGAVDTPMHEKSGNKVENKRAFKDKLVIARKMYEAIQNKTGMHTLSLDWAVMRKIVRMIG